MTAGRFSAPSLGPESVSGGDGVYSPTVYVGDTHMRFVFRALLGLVLLACASFAQAQTISVSGTARGIPFAPNCTASNGVNYSVGPGGITANSAPRPGANAYITNTIA